MIEPALNPVIAWAAHGETPHPLAITGGVIIVGVVAASSVFGRRQDDAATPAQ